MEHRAQALPECSAKIQYLKKLASTEALPRLCAFSGKWREATFQEPHSPIIGNGGSLAIFVSLDLLACIIVDAHIREDSMPGPKANILVVFYSRDGSVEALARAVSEGARDAGAEVRLRRVPDIVSSAVMAKVPGWEERSKRMLSEYGAPTPGDAEWADGIVFGTPTRFGNTSAELKAFIDSLGGLWFQGKLNGKAAGAFTSTAGPHGGNETTVVSLYIPMAHLGFIIVPNGYTHEKVIQGHGTPYGSSSTSGQSSTPPTADELVVAKHQGTRVTQVAAALKAAR